MWCHPSPMQCPCATKTYIKKVFPEIKKEALQRPVGPVDLILSMTE